MVLPQLPVFAYESVDSTQLHARRLLAAQQWADVGALFHVCADYQYAGRGRFSRTWDAPTGCASLVSTVVRFPADASARMQWVTAAVALAVCDTVRDVAPQIADMVQLSWPNDVLVGGRKIAGILAQAEASAAAFPSVSPSAPLTPADPATVSPTIDVVVGAGINVALEASSLPTPRATSLLALGVAPLPEVATVRSTFMALCEQRLNALVDPACDVSAVRSEFAAALTGVGQRVTATAMTENSSHRVCGVFQGVDEDGRALLSTDGGVIAVSSADISLSPDCEEIL